MKILNNPPRIRRLISEAIRDLELDLSGIRVLTEAASGPFVVTPLIAALAGAEQVVAVTRDSHYGSAQQVKAYTEAWARRFGVGHSIRISTAAPHTHAPEAELVTNLGFVRPIDSHFVSLLPKIAAIPLMWETWEFRPQDLDLRACQQKNVPVLGTIETHPRLKIFRYVGLVALKLLLEANIEVFRSNLLLIGSGHFGAETRGVLVANGANVLHLDPLRRWQPTDAVLESFVEQAEAIVLVEHEARQCLLGGDGGIPLSWLRDKGISLIHVCGHIDDQGIEEAGLPKFPSRRVAPGYMTVTTDYVGPRPVVDLNTAGLKVGEALVRGMRLFGNTGDAIRYALRNSPAMDWSGRERAYLDGHLHR